MGEMLQQNHHTAMKVMMIRSLVPPRWRCTGSLGSRLPQLHILPFVDLKQNACVLSYSYIWCLLHDMLNLVSSILVFSANGYKEEPNDWE